MHIHKLEHAHSHQTITQKSKTASFIFKEKIVAKNTFVHKTKICSFFSTLDCVLIVLSRNAQQHDFKFKIINLVSFSLHFCFYCKYRCRFCRTHCNALLLFFFVTSSSIRCFFSLFSFCTLSHKIYLLQLFALKWKFNNKIFLSPILPTFYFFVFEYLHSNMKIGSHVGCYEYDSNWF